MADADAARRALAAARLPFAPDADPDELAGILTRMLAIIGPRLGAPTRSSLPQREVAALLRAVNAVLDAAHRLRDAADPPPAVHPAYLDALLAWSGRVALADGRGAPARGRPFGAEPIVSLYVRAFARRPVAKANGPAHRYVKACLRAAGVQDATDYRATAILQVAGDVTADECLEFLRACEPFEMSIGRLLKEALDPSS
jgi:hypothetical protein